MKFNKLTFQYSATLQMRQFEPIAITVTVEAQVDPGESFDQVFTKVKKQVQTRVDEEIRAKKKERYESFMEEDSLEKNV